jgi:hypothetical protein
MTVQIATTQERTRDETSVRHYGGFSSRKRVTDALNRDEERLAE